MTIKEEDFLIQKFGRERHFTVPEGYFAQFHEKMMEQIATPKAEVRPLRRRSMWQTVVYAAACLFAAVVMTGAYFHADNVVAGKSTADKTAQTTATGDAIDQAADYMMLDESDLYAYMEEY